MRAKQLSRKGEEDTGLPVFPDRRGERVSVVARASSPWFRYPETIDRTRSMVKSGAFFTFSESLSVRSRISGEYDRSSRRTETTGWKPVLRQTLRVSERSGTDFNTTYELKSVMPNDFGCTSRCIGATTVSFRGSNECAGHIQSCHGAAHGHFIKTKVCHGAAHRHFIETEECRYAAYRHFIETKECRYAAHRHFTETKVCRCVVYRHSFALKNNTIRKKMWTDETMNRVSDTAVWVFIGTGWTMIKQVSDNAERME